MKDNKFLISGSYNPSAGRIQNYTLNISKILAFYSPKY